MVQLYVETQKVFGATGATGVLGQFGSFKNGSPTYSNDPDVIQALSNFGQGLAAGIVNNAPPAIQEIDALFYLISRQIAYLLQTGIPEWNANTTYYVGSFVSAINGENGAIFMSVANDNLGNDLDDTSKWMLYESNKFVAYTGASDYLVAYDDRYIEVQNAGNVNLVLPEAVSANKGRQIYVKNNSGNDLGVDAANVIVSALGTPASLIDGLATYTLKYLQIPRGYYATFVSNGSSWDITKRWGEL
jgi:hypothetical protein